MQRVTAGLALYASKVCSQLHLPPQALTSGLMEISLNFLGFVFPVSFFFFPVFVLFESCKVILDFLCMCGGFAWECGSVLVCA